MQKRKNLRLLAILISLIVITLFVMTLDNNGKRTSFDEKLFAVQDTAQVERIMITTQTFTNDLIKENNQWKVNGKYRLDEGLRRTLLPVIREIRIRRSVAESKKEEIVTLLKNKGVKIDIYNQKGLYASFLSAGIPEENLTYFMLSGKDQPYVVHLPGYESYVAGLFEITENDWRDRIVMNINWNSLNELKMEYLEEADKNFSIKASTNFFAIPGLHTMDSARVFDYLQEAQYVLTDKYLVQGEMPDYDSLAATSPFAVLSVEAIGQLSPETLSFFPLQTNDRYLLGKTGTGQLALFEYNRVKNLFVKLEDFNL